MKIAYIFPHKYVQNFNVLTNCEIFISYKIIP